MSHRPGAPFGGGEGNDGFFKDIFQGLNVLAGSQLFGAVSSFFLAGQQQEREDEFKKEQEGRFAEIQGLLGPELDTLLADTIRIADRVLIESEQFLGGAGDRFRATTDPLVSRANELAGQFVGVETEGRTQGAGLLADQRAFESRILSEHEGLGDVERQELNRRFGALGRTQQARLAGVGLGGTTAAASVAGGVERARSRDLGLLNENLRRDRIDLSRELGTETLSTLDLVNQRNLELSRDRIGAAGQALGFRTQVAGAGLEFEDRAFADLQDTRLTTGLLPATTALAGAERRVDILTEDVIFEAPFRSGLPQAIAGRSTQRG